MPWVEPLTWATGDLVTAGKLNTFLGDDLRYVRGEGAHGRPMARFTGTAMSLPEGSGQALFGTIVYDSAGYMNDFAARSGSQGPWLFIPEPDGYNLHVTRISTLSGGTSSGGGWFSSPSLFQTGMAFGTQAVTGYQVAISCLHQFALQSFDPNSSDYLAVTCLHGGPGPGVTYGTLSVTSEVMMMQGPYQGYDV